MTVRRLGLVLVRGAGSVVVHNHNFGPAPGAGDLLDVGEEPSCGFDQSRVDVWVFGRGDCLHDEPERYGP